MKILFVCSHDINSDYGNPFVRSIIGGLEKYGHEIVCNLEAFWNDYSEFDVLFFQWPEEIFQWNKNLIDLEKLNRHLDEISKTDVKMVVTCHNLHPHNNENLTTRLYNLLYSKVNAFHHMGKYSYQVLKTRYPFKYHFIASHQVADSLFDIPISTTEAKKKLNIPNNNIVISSFGAFRNEEETRLFLNMCKDVGHKNIHYLAPRIPIGKIYNGRWINKSLDYIITNIKYKYYRIKYSGILDAESLSQWLMASDIVFIQRKEILNSGNVPLAFSAGKIVVGPKKGNIGEILEETGNFTFNPNNRESVKKSVDKAILEIKGKNQQGLFNFNYAKKNWNINTISQILNTHLIIIMEQNYKSLL